MAAGLTPPYPRATLVPMDGALRIIPSQPLGFLAPKTASGGKIRAHRVAPERMPRNRLYRPGKTHLCNYDPAGPHILGNTPGNAIAGGIAQENNTAAQSPQAGSVPNNDAVGAAQGSDVTATPVTAGTGDNSQSGDIVVTAIRSNNGYSSSSSNNNFFFQINAQLRGGRIVVNPNRSNLPIPHLTLPKNDNARGFNSTLSYYYEDSSTLPLAWQYGSDSALAAVDNELSNQVTPGNSNGASPGGTLNDVGPLYPTAPWIGRSDNYVNSYVIPSPDASKYTDIYVNYTIGGAHDLTEGFVYRYGYLNANGGVTLVTYGEGDSVV